MKGLRERVSVYIDRFCAWYLSIITGIHIDFPKVHKAESSGDRGDKSCPSTTILRINPSYESRGNDTERINRNRSDEPYFMGSLKFYNDLREALRKQGLEYTGSYYGSSHDRHGGIRIPSQKTG